MNSDNKTYNDLHLLFRISVEGIEFAKRQQWQLTYYALILIVAVAYFKVNDQLPFLLGNVLIAAIAFFSIFLLNKIERDIVQCRKRIKQIHSRLSNEFQEIYELDEDYLKRKYKIGYFLILSITIAITAILLIFVPLLPNN